MRMCLLLVAALATGLIFAPAASAEDAMNPATLKNKTHKTAKVHKKIGKGSRSSAQVKKPDAMMGEPYSTQKDEMTR
jgi:pentapeptide MXKDX repeat protein